MAKRTFDDFNAFADNYREIHTQNLQISGADSFYFAELKVKLLRHAEKDLPLQVLDIGCGDGATEFFMQHIFPQWKILAIDVSEESIRVAGEKNLSNTVFSVYDGVHIPVADLSADIVFIAGVFHHVSFEIHAPLVKEITRVLRAGGRLYFFEHNPINPLTRYLVNTCVFDKDARLLKSGYAEQLFTKASLVGIRKKFIIFFPRKGIFSKLIFLEKYLQWLPLGGQYFISAQKRSM